MLHLQRVSWSHSETQARAHFKHHASYVNRMRSLISPAFAHVVRGLLGSSYCFLVQAIALGKRPHVLVGTPGRVVDHLSNTKVGPVPCHFDVRMREACDTRRGGVMCLLVRPCAVHSKLGQWLLRVSADVARAIQCDTGRSMSRLHVSLAIEACVSAYQV